MVDNISFNNASHVNSDFFKKNSPENDIVNKKKVTQKKTRDQIKKLFAPVVLSHLCY